MTDRNTLNILGLFTIYRETVYNTIGTRVSVAMIVIVISNSLGQSTIVLVAMMQSSVGFEPNPIKMRRLEKTGPKTFKSQ